MIDRNLSLLDDLSGNLCLVTGNNPPGVDNLVRSSAPSHRPIDAIASDARLIRNNRSALPNQTVEKGRFADVRSADESDKRLGHGTDHFFNVGVGRGLVIVSVAVGVMASPMTT